ncbi:MAG TPA: short-chain dehydrogenase [Nitrospiraceae bacterium]|nr:short-chain dehydrogenase [Nitrospiraceae bacterium]
MKRLEKKNAVITGGNSGIGLATAKAFVEQGARVIIFGRNQKSLDEAVKTIGGGILAVKGDVANPADLDILFNRAKEKLGSLDVLFVNAGIGKFAPFESISEAFFDEVMAVNFKGAFFTVQKALPLLNENASVILTTSITNQIGMQNSSVYAASKAALRSLARTLSGELVGKGIRVNAISPGPVATPIYDRMGMPKEAMDQMAKGIQEQTPMKRFGNPEEIAQAALFLAASDSSFMLGAEVVADGGMSQL